MEPHPELPPIMPPPSVVREPPHPGMTLLRRLPDTLSGPVRVRRRRRLWREWAPAIASLKGTALVVVSPAADGPVLAALDVADVVHHPSTGLFEFVTVRSSLPGVDVRLRFAEKAHDWLAALHALSRARAPRLADFDVVTPIGKGGGGEVYLVREKRPPGETPGPPLAMKVVQKHDAFYSDGSLRRALDERLVLELVRGFPFVISLTHAFQTESALYMVSQFCPGGDLRTLLRRQKGGRLSEGRARGIMAQLVLALEHVQSLNVIYRDIKPENVLLSADGDVRLCDFGLSKVLSTGRFGRTKSFCGSTPYMSPQIVTGKSYGIATDMWSMGALFYRMLVGRGPFEEPPHKLGSRNEAHDIQKRIQLEDPTFPSFLSSEAQEMLEALLRKDENERMNLQDLKESLFFKDVDWDALLEDGYERASHPVGVLMGNETENFDAERLVSHGVALQDKELHAAEKGSRKTEAANQGFVTRQTSRIASLSIGRRCDLEKTKKMSATSIIGFGYSYSSGASLNISDTDTSSSLRGNV